MSDQSYHPSKISPIVLGIILFVLFLMVLCSLPSLVKLAGYPFLWAPEQLGLLNVVHPNDVTVIHMGEGQNHTVTLTAPGWYQIYTNDSDLLQASDDLAVRSGKPWINARSPSGSPASIRFIERGLRPYDSPFAKGRPVMAIYVDEPGQYNLRHPTKPSDFSIAPDYTTGNEFTIYFFYILQFGVLMIPVAYFVRKSQIKLSRRINSVKQLKRIQGEDFWKRERTRQKDVEPKKAAAHNSGDKWW